MVAGPLALVAVVLAALAAAGVAALALLVVGSLAVALVTAALAAVVDLTVRASVVPTPRLHRLRSTRGRHRGRGPQPAGGAATGRSQGRRATHSVREARTVRSGRVASAPGPVSSASSAATSGVDSRSRSDETISLR